MTNLWDPILNWLAGPLSIGAVVLGSVVTLLTAIIAGRLLSRRLPIAYSIAVIGFPRSGKTTLITSMFGELFAKEFLGISVLTRGEETRKRVFDDLRRLEVGEALGPTIDQDLFAYRVDLIRGNWLFRRRYKLEIGDFPGEDSEEFTEKYGNWLHDTPYFKWAVEADAFIFVVDLAHYLNPSEARNYVASTTRSMQAAWHRLLEYHIEGKRNLKHKPVVVAFTKADLFGLTEEDVFDVTEEEASESKLSQKILSLGFGEKVPARVEISSALLMIQSERTLSAFDGLVNYFTSQSRRFRPVFVSCFGYVRGRRIGISEVLKAVLPR